MYIIFLERLDITNCFTKVLFRKLNFAVYVFTRKRNFQRKAYGLFADM